MNAFTYTRVHDVASAVREVASDRAAKFIAGGTNLIDLMKENVMRPSRLIDITHTALKEIGATEEGGLRLGALAKNTDVAYNKEIERRYPLLAKAILAGASPQLRNMATVGGNLMQRTRCCYFYDTATPCNKREPETGCSAIEGFNRAHAILGTSGYCIATHPSDMCVALAALEAVVHVTGSNGERAIPFAEFHRLPGDTPHIDTNLGVDEIITAVDVPAKGFAEYYSYLKIRDRASYAFALVSVAAALEMDGETIKEARLALGGVAHKPWRDPQVEKLLHGQTGHGRQFSARRRRTARRREGFRPQQFQDRAGEACRGAGLEPGSIRGGTLMKTEHIGKPINRVDGRAKVTGVAKYAAEYNVPDLAYGWVVSSAIARGKIAAIDAADALRLPGVLQVFTHKNSPRLAQSDDDYRDEVAPQGSPFRPLHDDEIKYSAQPVALVVADTLELARYAASLVRIEYECEEHATDLHKERGRAYEPKLRAFIPPPLRRGNPEGAFAEAAVRIEAEYNAPAEHHNPMEPFATTVVRDEDGRLTVYDKTQGVQNVQNYLCNVFGYSKGELRVLSPFVGGAFGSGLRPVYQVFLAVLAARELKRSVRVSLMRQQMFTLTHRPATWQRVALSCAPDGTLKAVMHDAIAETSRFEDYTENVVNWSALLYRCGNVKLGYKAVQLDLPTPGDMRAPGAVWGLYALECAMDELANKAGIDPIELRLKNYAETDQNEGKSFSSKELRACYRLGAEKFGWAQRTPAPRSMREGHTLIGWGMAGAVWDAFHLAADAKAVLTADGKLLVSSATEDIGTGTYTIMTQIAAQTLGLPIENVTFKLGDSLLPQAPVEGGSFTASTVGSAVKAVCEKIGRKLFRLARRIDGSTLANAKPGDVMFVDGQIQSRIDPSRAVSLIEVMRHCGLGAIEEKASARPAPKEMQYSHYTHSAIFAEVKVDQELGTVRVTRIVSAIAAGRILNPKTARSQVLGAIVGGIGTALEEESVIDHTLGRFMTRNLADYHVPVNADVHDIEVIFVEEKDDANPLGVKGLGEIGIVSVAAAIANAVFHATGKRVRDLPITLDKLL